MSDQDRRTLLRLLDAMDNHYDRRITDQEFLDLAASARASLDPAAGHAPGMAVPVRALAAFLSAAGSDLLPAGRYGDLRLALAELEEQRLAETAHAEDRKRSGHEG